MSWPTSIRFAERAARHDRRAQNVRAPRRLTQRETPMSTYVAHDETDYAPPAEVAEVELYHPKTLLGQYVWTQDAKVIAVQYAITAIGIGVVALVLSWLMRLQLGFPNRFSFIDPSTYLQFVTMHGMIMVIYLLTALFLGGFGNYLIPLMVRCPRHGVPLRQHAELLGLPVRGAAAAWRASSSPAGPPAPAGRCTRRRQFSKARPGSDLGHHPDAASRSRSSSSASRWAA